MPHKFGKENNRNPGTSQLGHSKGNKRAIPGEHWERTYDATNPSKNMILTEGADFNPKSSDERKTTHIKVNREDH